jgi:hypothetical protein
MLESDVLSHRKNLILAQKTSRDSLNFLLGGLQYQSVQYQAVNWINRYAKQYNAKLYTSLENTLELDYAIDSLIIIQIQPTNNKIAKYIDTKILVICVKMILHSSTMKLYHFWEFQVKDKIGLVIFLSAMSCTVNSCSNDIPYE